MTAKGSKPGKGPKKTLRLEFTPFSLLLWVFGLFFLLAWIFALGIFVGRGYLPGAVTALTDLKGQVSRLQEMVSKDRNSEKVRRNLRESDPKLAFYEKLSGMREEVKLRERSETKDSGKSRTGTKKQHEIPTVSRKDSQKPSPSPPRHGTGSGVRYTVQLASLSDRFGAKKMIDRLIAKGYDAYFRETYVKGKTYFRVRCGTFHSREEAERYARKLLEREGLKGFVSRVD
ncbi:MAG: SPOR domain-containing protein [Deltaproteobacteria bacterium]|nr:SPOR domain-containing protein [Deltaproteobacteria bacterium]MBW2015695.1 SPOR domain-containing protein [Deltaproteobacteria bacterium]MBW2304241.1 SPOR domain-containing protein [Deltaproteobacteria bacterium]